MENQSSTPETLHSHLSARISMYEARLREIDEGAECAYEKALARSFEQTLAALHATLRRSDAE